MNAAAPTTAFADYTALDLVQECSAYGLWWMDDEPGVQDAHVVDARLIVTMQDGSEVRLSGTDLRRAWSAFCNKYPNAALASERCGLDAEIAGVMVQMALWGDVVYG